MDKFYQTVLNLTEEFKESLNERFPISAEFSTSAENLDRKKSILTEFNLTLDNYIWVIYECETCADYDPNSPYHVEII